MLSKFLGLIIALFFLAGEAAADTVYFKNGRKTEGRVVHEDKDRIELDVGFGSIWFQRQGILKIEKSTPAELDVDFQKHNQIFVNSTLNGKVKCTLLLDTGASIVLLSKKLGERLGVKMDNPRYFIEAQVADGRKVRAYYVKLDSLKVQELEATGVDAAILVDEAPGELNFKDGLLGMSFLGRYSTRIDYAKKKLIIET